MVIYCSKAFQQHYKIQDSQLSTNITENELNSWHAHIRKINGKNTIILMNDKTMFSIILRNKIPRKVEKFLEIFKQAIIEIMISCGVNNTEIIKYMNNNKEIIFSKRSGRQITGNINELFFEISFNDDWSEETIQTYESSYYNSNHLRKLKSEYIYPTEALIDAILDELL